MLRTCAALMALAAALAPVEPGGVANSPAPPPRWSVRISTSGGFAGVGRGAVFVSSDGRLEAGRAGRPCEPATLSAEERRRIGLAVTHADPAAWAGGKPSFAAPDAFGYRLTLTRGEGPAERRDEAAWYDNTRERLPGDLEELVASVEAAWQRAGQACPR